MKRETRPGFRPKETYFDWDVQDRLVRVSLPDGARWRYRYDAFGRRINKVREGQLPSAQAVARVAYRWDGDQLIGQQQYYADGSAAREVQWVYEPGSFRPLAQVEAQGDSTQLHYIVTDLTGTARELCSEEGEIRWRGEQGLWGAHREERRPIPLRRYLGDAANEEVYCELRYQGQLYDAETGLYYNRHRYYDAESGQYLSPDPIGLGGGVRPQAYVHNPLEWVDPLGLTEKEGGEDYEYSFGSLRHSLRRHSPHVGPPRQEPYASMKPKRQKGSLFPSEWGNRDIASAAKEVANNPLNKIASNREGFFGNVFEGTATRNGVTQKIRVITDHADPHIGGTGSGIITSSIPIK